MRTDLMLIAAAALVTGAGSLATPPRADRAERALEERAFDDRALEGDRSAQTVGPLPSPVVNPGLGGAPPGGSLRERGAGPGTTGRPPDPLDPRPADRRVDPGEVPGGRDGAVPVDPGGRAGAIDGGHLGAPPANPVPDAPAGAVPPPPTGAVPPPAPPGGALPPADR